MTSKTGALIAESADHHRAVNEMLQVALLDIIASLDKPVDYLRTLQSRARLKANDGKDPYETRSLALDWVDELCEAYTVQALRKPAGFTPAVVDNLRDPTPRVVDLRQFLRP